MRDWGGAAPLRPSAICYREGRMASVALQVESREQRRAGPSLRLLLLLCLCCIHIVMYLYHRKT